MTFVPKPTRQKEQTEYKTLYIKSDLAEKINALATKHNTSFNNIVVSILEEFLAKEKL